MSELDDTMGIQIIRRSGYSPIEILRYYYGDDMYINTAEAISGIPSSWPGYTLKIGSSGNKVRQMQEQLNVIAGAYPAIPKITADGIYGPATAEAVRVFKKSLDCLRPEKWIIRPGIRYRRYMLECHGSRN